MNQDEKRNAARAIEVITQEYLKAARAKAPLPSINALARACVDANVKVSKPLVAQLRRKTLQAIQRTPPPTAQQLASGEAITIFDPTSRADPAELARERERKKAREAARQAEFAERQREQEERWARAREEEARQAEVRTLPPAPETPVPVVPAPAPAPRVRGTAAERALRRQFLNELLDADPGMEPVEAAARLKREFGVALDWGYIYETCRIAREVHQLPTIPEHTHTAGRESAPRTPLPVFEAAMEQAAEERAAGATPEEDLAWLVRQLGDLMRAHSLASVTVAASEAGASWEFVEKPREPRKGAGEVKF